MSVLSGVKQAWGGNGMGHKRRGQGHPERPARVLRETGTLQTQLKEPQLVP